MAISLNKLYKKVRLEARLAKTAKVVQQPGAFVMTLDELCQEELDCQEIRRQARLIVRQQLRQQGKFRKDLKVEMFPKLSHLIGEFRRKA